MGCNCGTFVFLLMVTNRYGTWTSTPLNKLTTSSDLNDSPNEGSNFGSPPMQSEEEKAAKISTKGPSCPKNGDRKQKDKRRKRIVGGEMYDPQFREAGEPHWEHWIASLQILLNQLPNSTSWEVNRCGAALITKKHVLTTAHCLTNIKKSPDILDPVYVRIFFDVENAKVHKGLRLASKKFFYVNMKDGGGKVEYYPNTTVVKDDIAVIELERDIEEKDCLHPIKITNKPLERPFRTKGARDRYWMAGWGTYTLAPGANRLPENLQYINSQPHIVCPHDQAIDIDKNICFQRTNQLGTCDADSGNPGVIKLKDEWYLQGIHKGAKGTCNETRSIGVDINVFKYRAQIEQWIKPLTLET